MFEKKKDRIQLYGLACQEGSEQGEKMASSPNQRKKHWDKNNLRQKKGSGLHKYFKALPDEEPISFEQENPKKEGSSSWDRYEVYKGATTMGELWQGKHNTGDLSWDYQRGYMRFTNPERAKAFADLAAQISQQVEEEATTAVPEEAKAGAKASGHPRGRTLAITAPPASASPRPCARRPPGRPWRPRRRASPRGR